METGKFYYLIEKANNLTHEGNDNYSIKYHLKDGEGIEYDYIQYKHIYIERRYNNHPKVGLSIFLDDGKEKGEVFYHKHTRAEIHVPKKLKKELVELFKMIDHDLRSVEKEKREKEKEKWDKVLKRFNYL